MNISSNDISCIILAGGQGKRFDERDKGLIELDGIPFIEHAVNRIKPQVNDIVISANRNLDQYAQYSPAIIKDNAAEYHGPLSGIASALPHCRHQWILVIPCDMPYLPADLVHRLISPMVDEQVAVAQANGQKQLVFIMHRSLHANLQHHVEQGLYKMMQWLQSHKTLVVEFPGDQRSFANINSDMDLSNLN